LLRRKRIMKKWTIVLVLLVLSTALVTAQGMDFSKFPVGKWLDPNYDAVWEATGNGLRILSPDGNVYFDFKGKTISDFSVGTRDGSPSISFYCKETGKTYYFTSPMTSKDVVLEIDRPNHPHYKVTMKPWS